MKSLLADAYTAVNAVPEGGFVRGIVVLQTKQGNFLTLQSGDNPELHAAAEAACVALGKEPDAH